MNGPYWPMFLDLFGNRPPDRREPHDPREPRALMAVLSLQHAARFTMPLPQRIPYQPLSEWDQFATIYRVARWLRGGVDWTTVDPRDAEMFQTTVWEPLTRPNPAERSISAEGVRHLNK